MPSVTPCPLPADALLRRYVDSGDYTDCFCIDAGSPVTQAEFVAAFYTTWIFRLERLILKLVLNRGSSDTDARRLAEAAADSFAAWRVEQRADDQLLLTDYAGQTRSWLMTRPAEDNGGATRLYFGSAIIARVDRHSGEREMKPLFRLLLGFHRLYSRLLLLAARSRLQHRLRR